MGDNDIMKKIMEIQRDPKLSDEEKAKRRQELLSGKWMAKISQSQGQNGTQGDPGASSGAADATEEADEGLKCAICFDICVRPVTAPCQHNFCLKCFESHISRAKNKSCPSCRHPIPRQIATNPRINTALALAIRAFKSKGTKPTSASQLQLRIDDKDRPDEAFVTERAQRAGRANAASGRIKVTIAPDHFGPIGPEHDPEEGKGVSVGRWWKDRLDCRQWGAHFPHVAGIAGQGNVGAQSVVLSGGYEDDRDEGEWFLYTGSGGRDLSGNKRTNNVQSFDQVFEKMNKALKLSCVKGLPVRVVRSYKEKRSAYAPSEDTPVRYDGLYRIVRCWRKKGQQGHLMCRYLFVRCDNEPAPWSIEETGDVPMDLEKALPAEALAEMRAADKKVIYSMGKDPYWDYNATTKSWGWAKPAPPSQKSGSRTGTGMGKKRASEHERALKELACKLCKEVLNSPVSAPCGHSFCKPCLERKFDGVAFEVDVGAASGRSLRVRKTAMPCPCCKVDLADFLRTAAVNRDMESMIEKLKSKVEEEKKALKDEDGDDDLDEDQKENEPSVMEKEEEKISTSPKRVVVGVGMAVATEAEKRAAALAVLAGEFMEYDRDLICELLEQEDGDDKAVWMALNRMRASEMADEKKKKKREGLKNEKKDGQVKSPGANGQSKKKRSAANTPNNNTPASAKRTRRN